MRRVKFFRNDVVLVEYSDLNTDTNKMVYIVFKYFPDQINELVNKKEIISNYVMSYNGGAVNEFQDDFIFEDNSDNEDYFADTRLLDDDNSEENKDEDEENEEEENKEENKDDKENEINNNPIMDDIFNIPLKEQPKKAKYIDVKNKNEKNKICAKRDDKIKSIMASDIDSFNIEDI
jgi:hypothetical protein